MKAIPIKVFLRGGQGESQIRLLTVPDKHHNIAEQLTDAGYTVTHETLSTGESSVCIEGREYDEECLVGKDVKALILQILEKAQARGLGGIIRAEKGLIWVGSKVVVRHKADALAIEWGFHFAEDLVRFLEGLSDKG